MNKDNPLDTFNEQVEVFRKTWSKYTEEFNGEKIMKRKLVNFLCELP